MMETPRRWSSLSEPLRGAAYVLALGIVVTFAGAAIAGALVWLMS